MPGLEAHCSDQIFQVPYFSWYPSVVTYCLFKSHGIVMTVELAV